MTLESFVVAPGERFDLVVDFSGHAGERIVLKSDAFEIMQFRVSQANRRRDDSSSPATLRPVPQDAGSIRRQNPPHLRCSNSKARTAIP